MITSVGVVTLAREGDVPTSVSEGGVRRALAGVGCTEIRHGDGRQPRVPLRVALVSWGGLCDRGSLAVTRSVHDDGERVKCG